jgi:hypothetical protein
MLRDLVHCSHSTVAIKTSSFAGVRTVLGAISIHKVVQFRGDAATVPENNQRLNDVDQDNKAQITLASLPALILE